MPVTSSESDSSQSLPPGATSRPGRRFHWGIAITVCVALASAWFFADWQHSRRSTEFRLICKKAAVTDDWELLHQSASEWLGWDNDCDEATLFLAEALAQKDEHASAVQLLNSVSDDYHSIVQVLSYKAEMLMADLRRPHDAATAWLAMLELEPNASVPRQRLIYVYAMTLQRQKMLALIMDSIKLNSEPQESYSYLLLANDLNFSDGLAMTTRWRSADKENRILEIAQAVYAARTLLDNSLPKFGTSTVMPGNRELLDLCLEKYPDSIEALALKIDEAIFAGKVDAVAKLLAQAPEAASQDNRFWRFRGWLLQSQGKLDSAEKAFRYSLELHPFAWRSRLLLADVLRKQTRPEEAEDESQLALLGKSLTNRILHSPNARDLDESLVTEMLEYVKRTGPQSVTDAFSRRLE
jgi:tetratricopeptide (TPR) repeat protein